MSQGNGTQGERINKFLSNAGVCSRRKADEWIDQGLVLIDGHIAQVGERVMPGADVRVKGRKITGEEEEIILLFHKPVGIVCTADPREKKNIVDYIHFPSRIYPVGRLDKDSRGLLLMTNRGDIVNRMMRSRNGHEKEYLVRVNRPIDGNFIEHMSSGVYLKELEQRTRPCRIWQVSERSFRIVLTQGLNRQIRRMCQELGYEVKDLLRERIMNLSLEGISEGKYRRILPQERAQLEEMLEGSQSDPLPERSQYGS